MRAWVSARRASGESIALVPTMGALHAGHLELVRKAKEATDRVVVSIFVNPTQFGPSEDLKAYPRVLDDDARQLADQGHADAIFAPADSEIYPAGSNLTWVEVLRLGDHLCGASRKGHFRGVTTVVSRLFAIVGPDVAVFGLKDAQQYFILKRMTKEMGFPVELIGVETVREDDGLALSSRNRYLTATMRSQAVVLSGALRECRNRIEKEGERSADTIISAMRSQIDTASEARPDYVSLVGTNDLQPLEFLKSGQTVLAAVAVYFGTARLIDNAIIEVP